MRRMNPLHGVGTFHSLSLAAGLTIVGLRISTAAIAATNKRPREIHASDPATGVEHGHGQNP
jgi:hypothetical protein